MSYFAAHFEEQLKLYKKQVCWIYKAVIWLHLVILIRYFQHRSVYYHSLVPKPGRDRSVE